MPDQPQTTPALVALMCLLVFSASAKAFNENGYSNGMTLEAVQRSVTMRGKTLRVLDTGQGQPATSFTEFSGSPGAYVFGDAFTFCNNRLIYYSTDIGGGISAFIRIVDRANRNWGDGAVSTLVNESSAGPINYLSISWKVGREDERVSVNSQEGYQPQITRSFGWLSSGCPPW